MTFLKKERAVNTARSFFKPRVTFLFLFFAPLHDILP